MKVYRTGHLCVMWVCYGLKLVNVYHYHIVLLTRRASLFASRAHTTSGCSRDNNNLLDCYVRGYEFQSVVNGSADTSSAQLVGREDGTSYVQVGNWQAHLSPFYRPLPAINSYQHFRFDSIHPGKVFARKTLDPPETELNASYRKQPEPLTFQEMNETESQEADHLWLFTRQRKAMIIWYPLLVPTDVAAALCLISRKVDRKLMVLPVETITRKASFGMTAGHGKVGRRMLICLSAATTIP